MKSPTRSLECLYLISRFLCSPLEAIYTLLIFIAAQELNMNALQITFLACSKPVSSLPAFYFSTFLATRQERYKRYLIAINSFAALPAIAFPFIQHNDLFVASHFIFMIGMRASFPVWNGLLKNGLSMDAMNKLQAKAIAVQQFLLISCPLIFGYLIDQDKEIWKVLFCLLGLMQLVNSFMLLKLSPEPLDLESTVSCKSRSPIKVSFWSQWQKIRNLPNTSPDYVRYLLLFFWGGAGLVMMQSVLPKFFKENLHLSYTALTCAISLCKGIALIGTARLWSQTLSNVSLYQLNYYINILSTLFIALMLLSNFQSNLIYLSYIVYGAMQAGCELSWNMSGPLFAKKNECTFYAGLNLPSIGLRGILFPLLAQTLLAYSSSNTVFLFAGLVTLTSVFYAHNLARRSSKNYASFRYL